MSGQGTAIKLVRSAGEISLNVRTKVLTTNRFYNLPTQQILSFYTVSHQARSAVQCLSEDS